MASVALCISSVTSIENSDCLRIGMPAYSLLRVRKTTHKISGCIGSTNVLKRSINIQIFVTDTTGTVQIRQNCFNYYLMQFT